MRGEVERWSKGTGGRKLEQQGEPRGADVRSTVRV